MSVMVGLGGLAEARCDRCLEARRMPIQQPLDLEGLRAIRPRAPVNLADAGSRQADEHAGER